MQKLLEKNTLMVKKMLELLKMWLKSIEQTTTLTNLQYWESFNKMQKEENNKKGQEGVPNNLTTVNQ